ncbi:MAG: hypothetical protein ACXABU_15940 [Candidatus Hodarchaeales archaeon]|jgi:hypothetical protein
MFERQHIRLLIPKVYCCLCTEISAKSDETYECDQCHRFICASCLEDLNIIGLDQCPYCTSTIDQLHMDTDKNISPKREIKSLKELKKLGRFYYQRKNWELAKYFLLKVLKLNPSDKQAKSMYIEADYKHRCYYQS